MENADNFVTETEVRILREGIKTKYNQYQVLDRSRFSDFEYNTNRANYEPLRESFEEEFYVVRGIDRNSPNIHIPSTNTLALLFTDDRYVPGKKILNTCRSYAQGKSRVSVATALPSSKRPEPAITEKLKKLGITSLLILAGFIALFAGSEWLVKPSASGLVIYRPTAKSVVQQELIVKGQAAHAEIVWLVVHPEKSHFYWVQPPAKVQDDGSWIGVVYIGGVSYDDAGRTYQIRAFVNPATKLMSAVMLKNWPRAELGSDTLNVVKASKPNDR